jgi:MFS family permease
LFIVSLTSGILLRPYTELLAGFADVVYGGGPAELASLTAAGGLGALCSGVFLAFRGRTRGLVKIMVIGGILGSIGLVAFAMQTWLPSGILIIAIASMLLLACHVGSYSLIQNATNRDMRGRVISVSVSITVGGPALGALLIGWFAEFVGLQWAVAVSALLALGIVLAVAARILKQREKMEAIPDNLD